MKRFILTGTPGCGKTAVLRALETKGFDVVEEAATDVIALGHARGQDELWRSPRFVEDILALQLERIAARKASTDRIQFHDRAPACTYALCRHLGYAIPASLESALALQAREKTFQRQVFFLENLGFCSPTAARRISYEDSLVFERTHEEAYRELGFELIRIAPTGVDVRAAEIAVKVSLPGRV